MHEEGARPDVAVAKIASRQHGVVSFAQLNWAGLDKDAIARRIAGGRLHRVHRGVYAVGHKGLSNEGMWMAAVLACGIRLHRSPSLTSAVTRRDGVPVATPARTIADLRTVSAPRELRRAIRQADYLGLPLGASARSDRTRSELEPCFLALCRRYRLPLPEVNVRVDRFTVDFLWREQQLIVETDGYAAHRGRQAFEDDRARDNCLVARGYSVLRFTEQKMENESAAAAVMIRHRLALAL